MDKTTWEWTIRAMTDLDKIAAKAKAAAKREPTLQGKLRLQAIANQAIAGRATVAQIFGRTIQE